MSTKCLEINNKPLKSRVDKLPEIELKAVDQTELESTWNNLVSSYHYLGFKKMVGARIKYLAFAKERIVACLGYRAASLKLESRDDFIGWEPKKRRNNLKHLANNSRFLILPWIKVENLGSHLLAKSIDRLKEDWEEKYGKKLLLVETFIDPDKFTGTVYRAANWIKIGQTKGYTKESGKYVYHGNVKDIYLYPVTADFRKIIGCTKGRTKPKSKPKPKPSPSPRYLQIDDNKGEELKMMLQDKSWHPDIAKLVGLTVKTIEKLADKLYSYHGYFKSAFTQIENFKYGLVYLKGLTSDLPRKTLEGIALKYFEPKKVRGMQRFLSQYSWDDEEVHYLYQKRLADNISQPGGMFALDGSEIIKKGKESVGVAPQYCGRLGKVANCQSGVFLSYTSAKGYGFVDTRLYLPEIWFSPEYDERREKCHIPEDIEFKTKTEIAAELLEKAKEAGHFQADWVAFDSFFGRDKDFLETVGEHYTYLAGIPCDTQIWREWPEVKLPPYKGVGRKPKKEKALTPSRSVKEVADDEDIFWREVTISQGAKGPIKSEVARLRVVTSRDELPHEECWLIIRKRADGKLSFYLSNASSDILFQDMISKLSMRWPVEQCFQEGKSELGMADYELRSWPGWHRHMLYVFLAMLFLLEVRFEFKKNGKPILTLSLAKMLVNAVLDPYKNPKKELENVKYHLERNHRAYKSHAAGET